MSHVAPLVSIIITCFDKSGYAYESVLSAKRAYSGPMEIVIVEHGDEMSRTNPRLEGVAQGERDKRCPIEILREENRCVWAARNSGIARARGEFAQLLECGDLLLPGKLDDQILHFGVVDALDISLTDCLFCNANVDIFKRRTLVDNDAESETDEFAASGACRVSLPITCALFRRLFFAAFTFNEKLAAGEDGRVWQRLAEAGARIAFLGGPGAVRRVHDAAGAGSSPRRRGAQAELGATQSTGSAAARIGLLRATRNDGETDRLRSSGSVSPGVSIVIPVHEHFEYLERCLASAAVQGDAEIIVVDDASRDPRIRPLLQRFAAETGAKAIFQQENYGVAVTLNAGVANASGEYIAFLDCDDTLESEALCKCMEYIGANPDCDYLFTDRYDISDNDEILRLARYGGYRDDRFSGEFRRDLINGMVASHLKVIRRAAILRAGGFEAASSGVQDWVMALEIAEFGRFGYLPEPLYNYRVHSATVTRSDMRGQILRANVVRRRFAARYFKQHDADCRFRDGAESDLTPLVLTPAEIAVRELGGLWSRRPLVIDTTAGVTDIELWRLREFSGYFDKILWSAPETFAALLGYVWSPEILQRA